MCLTLTLSIIHICITWAKRPAVRRWIINGLITSFQCRRLDFKLKKTLIVEIMRVIISLTSGGLLDLLPSRPWHQRMTHRRITLLPHTCVIHTLYAWGQSVHIVSGKHTHTLQWPLTPPRVGKQGIYWLIHICTCCHGVWWLGSLMKNTKLSSFLTFKQFKLYHFLCSLLLGYV